MTENEIELKLNVEILKAEKAHVGYYPDNETRLEHGLVEMDYPDNAVRMTYSWDGEPLLRATMHEGKIHAHRLYKEVNNETMDTE